MNMYPGIRRNMRSFIQDPTEYSQKENLIDEFLRGKENKTIYHYGIFLSENNKLIGVIKLGIINWTNQSSDMITFIGDKNYLGKGLAIEAIKLGNEIAFETHGLKKLYGGMYRDNVGSVKAYLKANWIIEGILKDHYLVDGKPQDRILVACFNPNFYKDDYHKKGTVSFEEAYKLVSYLRLQNLYEDCVNFAFKLFTNFIRSLFLGAMLQ